MDYSSQYLTKSLKSLVKGNVIIQEARVVKDSYDPDTKSVDVIPLTEILGTKIRDVRIKAKFIYDPAIMEPHSDLTEGEQQDDANSPLLEGGVEYKPKEGSHVMIGFIEGCEHDAVILAYSDLEQVRTIIDDHQLVINSELIQLKNTVREIEQKDSSSSSQNEQKSILESTLGQTKETLKNELTLSPTSILIQQFDEEGQAVEKDSEKPFSQVLIDKGQVIIKHYNAQQKLASKSVVNATGLQLTKYQENGEDPQNEVIIDQESIQLNHKDGKKLKSTIKITNDMIEIEGDQIQADADTVNITGNQNTTITGNTNMTVKGTAVTVEGATINVAASGALGMSSGAEGISLKSENSTEDFGGLVKIETLVAKLNRLEQFMNLHVHATLGAVATIPPPLPPPGAEVPGIIPAITKKVELENDKVTHGG